MDDYAELTTNEACGGEVTAEEMERLTADPKAWAAALGATIADLSGQLSTTVYNDREDYYEWRRNVLWLKRKVETRLPAVRRLITARHEALSLSAYTQLRYAVLDHQRASREAGLEPEPHDLVLWGRIEELDQVQQS